MFTDPQARTRGATARAPRVLPRPRPDQHAERVVLLGSDGTPVGTAAKSSVHGVDTPLHLAFSCYLFDGTGRVLLTRRALGKATWPGVWTNSCCGHPQPGEDPVQAVHRRVREELGIGVADLRCVLPRFSYRAVDASGLVENEICPVSVGLASPGTDLAPDPTEVMATQWVRWSDLVAAARAVPQLLSPWSALQIPLLVPHVAALNLEELA